MIQYFCGDNSIVRLLGIIFSFCITIMMTEYFKDKLPTDQGRAFAHDGTLSKGKPRGAGVVFISVYILCSIVFAKFSTEHGIYLLLVLACMLTGFFDDKAHTPWGEYKKGLLDLFLSVATAVVYIVFNGSDIWFRIFNLHIHFNPILLGFIIAAMVWGSINVTNCADGVDGLSASLTIITLGTIYLIMLSDGTVNDGYYILVFCTCLIAYLWYNATPSILMMGDAGSRAMGIFIAIMALKTGSMFLYLLIAIVLILDGGLGLLKVALLRFCKIHILKNIRTPLHDQVRKNMGWSNTHCVFRFVIIQAFINVIVLYLINAFSI